LVSAGDRRHDRAITDNQRHNFAGRLRVRLGRDML
jgi:hypothetical protein